MKKLFNISMMTVMVLMVSCHSRKKIEDLQVHAVSNITTNFDSAKAVTDHKFIHIDSSRLEKNDSSVNSSRESFDFTFYLKGKPFKLPADSAGTGERDVINGMISQALANSDSAKVHVERVRNHRRGSKTIQQVAVKDIGTSHQEQSNVKSKLKTIKTLDKQTHSELKTTPDYAWICWLAALLIVIFGSLYIHHKLFPVA